MLKYSLRLHLKLAHHSTTQSGGPVKGIILVAGSGTRRGVTTLGIDPDNGVGISKALVETHDKPTICYPLHDLILAGLEDILVITSPKARKQYQRFLGDGSALGINLNYAVQEKPKGIADAFPIGANFIGNDDVMLTFGDNIFSGVDYIEALKRSTRPDGAIIFALYVRNPKDFGVVEFDDDGKAISLEEKPAQPKSPYAVPGIYSYDSSVVDISRSIEPSARGELEITDVNKVYLESGKLYVEKLDSDTHWFDTGSAETNSEAAGFVQQFQRQNRRLLGSPHAAAFQAGRIDSEQLLRLAHKFGKSTYGNLLTELAENGWPTLKR